ncbi:MAG: hypothetical protein J6E48_10530 [Prevotella sp.]|nr:hypothetical protein [Prevotella sp.]
MKQKRTYEQPRTDVVELRVTNQLLAGSTLQSLDDFQDGGNPVMPSSSRMDDDMSWMLQ